jgi:hypothetical protein
MTSETLAAGLALAEDGPAWAGPAPLPQAATASAHSAADTT